MSAIHRRATIFGLMLTTLIAQSGLCAQASLRLKLTDKRGEVVELSEPSIDYTTYELFYTSDREPNGIRIKQGPGEVIVEWSKIREIRFLERARRNDPYYIYAEMTLATGEILEVDVLDPAVGRGHSEGGGRLKGKTSLGDFSADLVDLRNIAVLPPRQDQ